MWTIIAILNTLFFPILQILLGYFIINQVYKYFKSDYSLKDSRLEICFVAGLLFHLILAFVLKLVGASWEIATYLPLLLTCPTLKYTIEVVKRLKPKPSANFLLWFLIVVGLGLSLFSAFDELKTPYTNNYGDIAFHFGIITSFVFGNNFPPEYIVFAGPRLSYPFLVNFWSALLWWPAGESWRILSFIFFMQWTIVWLLVYQFLSGWKYWLLPWAVLFGGGSYYMIGQYSHISISTGYPWVVFINSVWIPQRSFLMGLMFSLTMLHIFYFGFKKAEKELFCVVDSDAKARAILLAVFSALSLLGHGHSVFVTGLFIALVSLFQIVSNYYKYRDTSSIKSILSVVGIALLFFVVSMFLVAPYIFGKASMTKLMPGWLVGQDGVVGIKRVLASINMWFSNAGFCLVLLLPAIVFGKFIRESLAVVILFLVFNVVNLAFWDWDQMKIFMTIYLILVAVWSFAEEAPIWRLHLITIILIIPGFLETLKVFQEGPNFGVYDQEKINQAKKIITHTEAGAIIASAPDHNNVVTLSGRRLFSGYAGTLWSHGLDFQDRERIQKDFNLLVKCKEVANEKDRPYCPQYLAWGSAEKRFWQNVNPESFGLESVVDGIYRFR